MGGWHQGCRLGLGGMGVLGLVWVRLGVGIEVEVKEGVGEGGVWRPRDICFLCPPDQLSETMEIGLWGLRGDTDRL